MPSEKRFLFICIDRQEHKAGVAAVTTPVLTLCPNSCGETKKSAAPERLPLEGKLSAQLTDEVSFFLCARRSKTPQKVGSHPVEIPVDVVVGITYDRYPKLFQFAVPLSVGSDAFLIVVL